MMLYWYMQFLEGMENNHVIKLTIEQRMNQSKYFRRYWRNASANWQETGMDHPKHREFCEICEAAYQSSLAKEEVVTKPE